ncbi:MAG: hypothetical protein ABIG95_07100 [Candidatus Woesearchaeota archaeon]
MSIDEIIPTVVAYLRDVGVLQGSPRFAWTRSYPTDPEAIDPFNFGRPDMWEVRDLHKEVYEAMVARFGVIDYDEVQQWGIDNIPNSAGTHIVEFGCEFGNKGAGYLASKKPDTHVTLVSGPLRNVFAPLQLTHNYTLWQHVLTFADVPAQPRISDVARFINELYAKNGIGNVCFYEYLLSAEDCDNLPEFLRVAGEVFLYGHQAPGELPFIIGRLYRQLNARYMCVSLSAPEKMDPMSFVWPYIQVYLGLDYAQLAGLKDSIYDNRSSFLKAKIPRYDYRDPSQKRVGVMIQLALALVLAKMVDGEVVRNGFEDDVFGFNKPGWYVVAGAY